jgi:hypothetical protein
MPAESTLSFFADGCFLPPAFSALNKLNPTPWPSCSLHADAQLVLPPPTLPLATRLAYFCFVGSLPSVAVTAPVPLLPSSFPASTVRSPGLKPNLPGMPISRHAALPEGHFAQPVICRALFTDFPRCARKTGISESEVWIAFHTKRPLLLLFRQYAEDRRSATAAPFSGGIAASSSTCMVVELRSEISSRWEFSPGGPR